MKILRSLCQMTVVFAEQKRTGSLIFDALSKSVVGSDFQRLKTNPQLLRIGMSTFMAIESSNREQFVNKEALWRELRGKSSALIVLPSDEERLEVILSGLLENTNEGFCNLFLVSEDLYATEGTVEKLKRDGIILAENKNKKKAVKGRGQKKWWFIDKHGKKVYFNSREFSEVMRCLEDRGEDTYYYTRPPTSENYDMATPDLLRENFCEFASDEVVMHFSEASHSENLGMNVIEWLRKHRDILKGRCELVLYYEKFGQRINVMGSIHKVSISRLREKVTSAGGKVLYEREIGFDGGEEADEVPAQTRKRAEQTALREEKVDEVMSELGECLNRQLS
eukprot:TRINITY_DN3240_c0_g1_i2.p1 TRINITY_DN3240_c0_g1~~TRINITY_DN3240_c0_g1_i2.p1  ORF type:complete len:337 (+),score=27.15 TRINITY_DN3240_c0_g1_i2:424-1434(+)